MTLTLLMLSQYLISNELDVSLNKILLLDLLLTLNLQSLIKMIFICFSEKLTGKVLDV